MYQCASECRFPEAWICRLSRISRSVRDEKLIIYHRKKMAVTGGEDTVTGRL